MSWLLMPLEVMFDIVDLTAVSPPGCSSETAQTSSLSHSGWWLWYPENVIELLPFNSHKLDNTGLSLLFFGGGPH